MHFIPVNLADLIERFGGAVSLPTGEEISLQNVLLSKFAPLHSGESGSLGFLSNKKLKHKLLETSCTAVLVRTDQVDELIDVCNTAEIPKRPILWAVKDPYLAYARIQQWWVELSTPESPGGIHAQAVISEGARIHPTATIEANAVIEAGATVDEFALIKAGSFIGRDAYIGKRTIVYANATIYQECLIGSNCIIHSGAVIGADGFGFANEGGKWIKIPQVGRVVIADEVEVGANTTIDRGALEDTLIGFGVKLDNQIMVAHNVTIGDHTALAGCVGIAGSTHIGARCTIGGAAMLLGHLSIPDGTHVSGASTVMSTIKEPGAYSGIFPLDTHKAWEKTAVTLKQLTDLRQRIRALERNQDH